jgi:hypothetical protein
MVRSVVVASLFLGLAVPGGVQVALGQKKGPAIPPLNQKVLAFARAHKGQQVGDGECWTLADAALKAAGARRPGSGGLGPFAFGRLLGPRETALPGDIAQFSKARFQGKTNRGFVYGYVMDRHTAIIASVKGTRITVLHQNFGERDGGKIVRRTPINLADRKQGTVQIYRPQPARDK